MDVSFAYGSIGMDSSSTEQTGMQDSLNRIAEREIPDSKGSQIYNRECKQTKRIEQ